MSITWMAPELRRFKIGAQKSPAMSSPLFTAVQFVGRQAPPRVVMAPRTRGLEHAARAMCPTRWNARYYSQRPCAALIVSEATQVFTPKARALVHARQLQRRTCPQDGACDRGRSLPRSGLLFCTAVARPAGLHSIFHDGTYRSMPSAVAFEGKNLESGTRRRERRMVTCPRPGF